MKNGKTTSPNDILVEVWKILSRQGAKILAALFKQILKEGAAQAAYTTSITVPIWKSKGEISECLNYWLFRLVCHTMKISEHQTPQNCLCHSKSIWLWEREWNNGRHSCCSVAFREAPWKDQARPHKLIWHTLWSHNVLEAYIQWIQLLVSLAWSDVHWEYCLPSASTLEYIKDLCFCSYYSSFAWTLWCLTNHHPIHGHFSMSGTHQCCLDAVAPDNWSPVWSSSAPCFKSKIDNGSAPSCPRSDSQRWQSMSTSSKWWKCWCSFGALN